MSYTFKAGPDFESFTIETPWSERGVSMACEVLGLSEAEMQGAICMLLHPDAESFLDMPIIGTGSRRRRTTLCGVHAALAKWTRVDEDAELFSARVGRRN